MADNNWTLHPTNRNIVKVNGVWHPITRKWVGMRARPGRWKYITSNRYGSSVLGITEDGILWGWGRSEYNSLWKTGEPTPALDDTMMYDDAFQMLYISTRPKIVDTKNTYKCVATYSETVIAIREDGTLWQWGGYYNVIPPDNPLQIGTDSDWEFVLREGSVGLFLKTDGSLWAYGNDGGDYSLGLGDSTGTNGEIVRVGTDLWDKVKFAPGGRVSAGINKAGDVYKWGLGNPWATSVIDNGARQKVPTLVPGSVTSKVINVEQVRVGVVTDDGMMLGGGSNSNYTMGFSSTSLRSVLTRVDNALWKDVSWGSQYGIGVKTNGTLWAWGGRYSPYNYGGSEWRVPTLKNADTDWEKVFAFENQCYAIKTDGTLWAWGSSSGVWDGSLGLGDVNPRAQPEMIV